MVAQYFAQLDENNVVINVHVVTAEFMAANPERYKVFGLKHFLMIQTNNMLALVLHTTTTHKILRRHHHQSSQ
jgi:hypothetical protein